MEPDDDVSARELAALHRLEGRFLTALAARDAGRLDAAEDDLREILKVEPRLPEPHMELARILLDTDRLTEAEPHAREAIRWLDQGGVWTDEIPEDVVKGLAHGLLAEILRRRADEDDVLFGDPAAFHALVAESREHYRKAASYDPSDEYASYHAFFLGVPGGGAVLPGEAIDVDAPPEAEE
jgi:tetratricopeptide (TPR) repeat protein